MPKVKKEIEKANKKLAEKIRNTKKEDENDNIDEQKTDLSEKMTDNEEKQKTDLSEKKTNERPNHNIFLAIGGGALVSIILTVIVGIIITGNLGILIMLIPAFVLGWVIKKHDIVSDKDRRYVSIMSFIVIVLLSLFITFVTLQEKKVIAFQGYIINNLHSTNQQLRIDINNANNYISELSKKYQNEVDRLREEKLKYGEKVKNKTIDIIIKNLEYLKKQNISKIDISDNKKMTKQKMEEEMTKEQIENGSIDLEN